VTLINKDAATEHDVQLSVAGATTPGSLETLQAPSVSSTSGITLGGQTFGDETTTGNLPAAPATTPVAPVAGTYTVALPAGSAAMLTIGGGGGGGIGLTRRP
jgi:hypothetical protein